MATATKKGYVAAFAALLLLGGCATTEGYQQHMDLMVGQSGDQLKVQWGVPDQTSTLSDGRLLWSYHRTTENRSGGYWSNRTRSRTETYKDSTGKVQTRTVSYSEPYYEPEVVTHSECETRFILSPDQKVQSVSFEGTGCVAEELDKK